MAVFDNLNATYSAGIAPEVTKYFDRELLRETEAALVHQRDLQKRTLPPKNGKTVQFRKFHAFTPDATPLKEGVTPAGQTLVVSEIHATVKPYGKHVEYTDELDLTTIDNNVQEAAKMLARQARETLDKICADALSSGSNVIFCDAGGGVNTSRADIVAGTDVLDSKHIKRAVRQLEKANAERFPDGYYHAIIDPETKFDLTSDALWVDVAKYQNSEKIDQYELGKMLGVKFYETTMTKVFHNGENLYVDSGVGVTNLALNGGAWTASSKTGIPYLRSYSLCVSNECADKSFAVNFAAFISYDEDAQMLIHRLENMEGLMPLVRSSKVWNMAANEGAFGNMATDYRQTMDNAVYCPGSFDNLIYRKTNEYTASFFTGSNDRFNAEACYGLLD